MVVVSVLFGVGGVVVVDCSGSFVECESGEEFGVFV